MSSFAAGSVRNWPIATKINAVQAAALVSLLLLAIAAMTFWLGHVLEDKNLTAIRQANQQAIDLIDAYGSSLEKSAEKLGNVLAADYPQGFTVDESATVDIGGKSTPLLKTGGATVNLNFDIIDRFSAVTGANATVFARQGDDFVRVATSVKKENGERAIGTTLGAAHPAHDLLLKGEAFTGKTRLFGRDYMTRYIPQRDKAGKVVAVLYIGLDFTTELAVLKEKLKSVKFNKTGYIFALDAGKDAGTLTVHPTQEGKNLLDAKDPDGVAYVRDMVEKKNGQIEYKFMNASQGETAPRAKIAVFAHYPKWNWVIASSCYMEELSEEAMAVRNQLVLGAVALAAVLFAVIYFSLHRWVTTPLQSAVGAMQAIAGGNLAVAIPAHGNDEVGQLLTATRQMAKAMTEAIVDIQGASTQLVGSARDLSQASHQVATQSGQQSEAASSMAANIEQMNESIGHVRDIALDTKEITDNAGQTAVHGASIIGQAVTSMTRIADTVRQASGSVSQLGQESEAIAAIVNTIKGIADQTNLLALNAAIEAARAGEAGRGFAVVADEVRKLAERTSTSTQEIEAMIARILAGTRDAVGSMEKGVDQVDNGVTLAGQAGSSIAEIRSSAEQVSDAVSSISQALAQQTSASGEIAQNVIHIASMADKNHGMARNSAQHADRLEELAHTLTSRVARFTVAAR